MAPNIDVKSSLTTEQKSPNQEVIIFHFPFFIFHLCDEKLVQQNGKWQMENGNWKMNEINETTI